MKKRLKTKIARRYAQGNRKGRPHDREGTLIRSGVHKPGPNFPSVAELASLVSDVKKDIRDANEQDEEDDVPGIHLTVGADGKGKWSYQTGDNSYSGGAYGFRHWGQCDVYPGTNPREAAQEILGELRESFWQSK